LHCKHDLQADFEWLLLASLITTTLVITVTCGTDPTQPPAVQVAARRKGFGKKHAFGKGHGLGLGHGHGSYYGGHGYHQPPGLYGHGYGGYSPYAYASSYGAGGYGYGGESLMDCPPPLPFFI
jgi:hypothetical protein